MHTRRRESLMKPKRIAIYCRVSTDDQRIDLQQDALLQYAEARGMEIFKVYVDQISGARDSRPALNELLADARRRRFDSLAVWKIDRLGRSVQHLLAVLSQLQELGISFVSLQEALDTTTAAGRMLFVFLGAVAEFERAIISERVKAGLQAAKKRGKKLGRPGKEVNVDQFKRLIIEGLSIHAAAKQLEIPLTTAYRLKNRTLMASFA